LPLRPASVNAAVEKGWVAAAGSGGWCSGGRWRRTAVRLPGRIREVGWDRACYARTIGSRRTRTERCVIVTIAPA
jgi:hypothetical protein